ncbi:MAG: hypothetical protein HMLKMBBP_02274 [Planctomycetes bacterium]|nr:hypothetical protein [Planctomycetota bacterium]
MTNPDRRRAAAACAAAVAALWVGITAAAPRGLALCTPPPPLPEWLFPGPVDEGTRVRGCVVDSDGLGVEGACVVVHTGVADCCGTTNSAGVFDVAVPTSSPVAQCMVAKAGFAMHLGPWFAVAQDRGAEVGTITMAPAAVVEGAVVDESGNPVPWAWIDVSRDNRGLRRWPAAFGTGITRFVCDPVTGAFRIDTLPAGTHCVSARGLAPQTDGWRTFDAPSTDVRVSLDRDFERPMFVVPYEWGDPPPYRGDYELVAESEAGVFRPDGNRLLHSRLGCGFPIPPPFRLVFPENEDYERADVLIDRVILDPVVISPRPKRVSAQDAGGHASLRGVVAAGGSPVMWIDGGAVQSGTRCLVRATLSRPGGADRGPSPSAETLTEPDGSFRLDRLLLGGYWFSASVETTFGDPLDAPIDGSYDSVATASADPAPVRISLATRSSHDLRIEVPESILGAPDRRLEVLAWQAGARRRCDVTWSGVRVRGIAPGTFSVSVRARANGVWTRRVLIECDTQKPLPRLVVPTGRTISGRVVRGDAPVPGVEVLIKPTPWSGVDADIAVTDMDGRFAVAGFDPGSEWIVSAWHPGVGIPAEKAGQTPVVLRFRDPEAASR